jgi:hypothetical protein
MEKLNSENYHNWKFDMKMLLVGKDLWDIVTGEEKLEEEATEKERTHYRKCDNKALSMICLGINSELKIYVRSAKSAQEAWESLNKHFEEKTLSKKIMYRRKLYELKMDENTTMIEHINKMKTIAEHLEALDDAVLEKDIVMILLSSLPPDYNNLITTLETLKEENLGWDYVRDRLLTEFERRRGPGREPHNEALFVGGNPRGSNFPRNNKSRFPCHYCGEVGHFVKECEDKKNDELEKEMKRKEELEKEKKKIKEELEKEVRESAAFTQSNEKFKEDDFVPEFALHVGELQEKWLLDSGCSRHITGNKDDLENYRDIEEDDDEESHYVTLADKSIVHAVGRGDLNVYLNDVGGVKVPVTFKDVLYIPKMKRLISIGQLTKRGGEVVFREKSVELRVSGRKFKFGSKVGKLYKMNWCNFVAAEGDESKEEVNAEPVGVEKKEIEFEGVISAKFNVSNL